MDRRPDRALVTCHLCLVCQIHHHCGTFNEIPLRQNISSAAMTDEAYAHVVIGAATVGLYLYCVTHPQSILSSSQGIALYIPPVVRTNTIIQQKLRSYKDDVDPRAPRFNTLFYSRFFGSPSSNIANRGNSFAIARPSSRRRCRLPAKPSWPLGCLSPTEKLRRRHARVSFQPRHYHVPGRRLPQT